MAGGLVEWRNRDQRRRGLSISGSGKLCGERLKATGLTRPLFARTAFLHPGLLGVGLISIEFPRCLGKLFELLKRRGGGEIGIPRLWSRFLRDSFKIIVNLFEFLVLYV